MVVDEVVWHGDWLDIPVLAVESGGQLVGWIENRTKLMGWIELGGLLVGWMENRTKLVGWMDI